MQRTTNRPSVQVSPSARLKQARELGDANDIVLGLEWDGEQSRPGEPFCVRRELLKEGHMHLRGRTRSGKTSLAIAPLVEQLLRPYEQAYVLPDETTESVRLRDPVFVFDLGGDLALFNFVMDTARHTRRTFRFLSLDPADDWDFFDPFQLVAGGEDRVIHIAAMLVQAFSLDYGLVYGGSYYTQRNVAALLRVARRLIRQRQSSKNARQLSIDDVAKYLEKTKQRDEEEIRFTFDFLLEYEQLDPKAGATNTIDMSRALTDGEVIYFFCPTMGEATTARQIAGLGLYTLIGAAMKRVRHLAKDERGRPLPHAWVFVDEFQELAGRSFAALLAQSSKFGVSLVMANQTTTQLKTRDLDLSDIVRDNTHTKIYFTVTGRQDIEQLQSFSKDDTRLLTRRGRSVKGLSSSQTESETEVLTSVLGKDEILDTSATHKHCFLILDDGTGHREPIRLYTDYTIDEAHFRRHKSTPPPMRGEPREAQREPGVPAAPSWQCTETDGPVAKRRSQLADMLRLKAGEEDPQAAFRLLFARS